MPTNPQPITQSQFVRLMDEGLKEVAEDKYAELKGMREMLYKMDTSDSAFEEYYSVNGLGDIPDFAGKLEYLGVTPGFYIKVEFKEFGAAVATERKFLDDKKYGVLGDIAGKLAVAAHRTKEKDALVPFRNATTTAFEYMTSYEENVALASNSHTTKSGVSTSTGFDNLSSGGLNKTNVAAARLAMRKFRDNDGNRIDVGDDLVILCPDALADTAYEIVGTPKGLKTAEHTTNVQYQRHEVIPYLRWDDYSTTDWALIWKSQMKEDLVWIDRIMPDFQATTDFETKQTKQSVYYRCGYMFKDWRWIYFMDN